MPTDARRHVVAVEKTVNDPLQDTPDAFTEAAAYVAQLPEQTGDLRADQLRAWFLDRAAQLQPLCGAERAYVIDRSIGAVLEIGFLLGDLTQDWRR